MCLSQRNQSTRKSFVKVSDVQRGTRGCAENALNRCQSILHAVMKLANEKLLAFLRVYMIGNIAPLNENSRRFPGFIQNRLINEIDITPFRLTGWLGLQQYRQPPADERFAAGVNLVEQIKKALVR